MDEIRPHEKSGSAFIRGIDEFCKGGYVGHTGIYLGIPGYIPDYDLGVPGYIPEYDPLEVPGYIPEYNPVPGYIPEYALWGYPGTYRV